MTGLSGKIIGTNGQIIDCGAVPFELATDPGFVGMSTVQVTTARAGGLLAGSFARRARFAESPLRWAVRINADTQQELLEHIETLSSVVVPVGAGGSVQSCRLQVIRPDGTSRIVSGHYTTGLEAVPVLDFETRSARVDLIFRCPDPHWQVLDTEDVEVALPVSGSGLSATDFDEAGLSFDDAEFPFSGFQATDEAGTAAVVFTNVGTVPTFPIWNIRGQADSVEVANLTTGETWRYGAAVASNAELVVDTNDRRPTVRVDGANAYGGMGAGSCLFALQPGDNEIAVTFTNADTQSLMSASWRPRYMTP